MADEPKPRGEAILWSDDELDDLARFVDDDLDEAKALWREEADPEMRALLDAEVDETAGPA